MNGVWENAQQVAPMIGVIGGTFDPIHFGHLRPALDVLQSLGLGQVRFVPLNIAVHRPQPLANARQRLAMVRLAVAGVPEFVVDTRELERDGGSYSYDTARSMREEIGHERGLCLLVGADAFRDFTTWHRYEALLELVHLVVMHRPGEPSPATAEPWATERLVADRNELCRTPAGSILFQEVTQLDISATTIRALIARGASPRFLLPDAVLGLIERESIYGKALS